MFLDMTVRIMCNKVVTDLFRKLSDKVQYLLPSSCHPSHIFKSIPYSLALRLVRICSTKELLNKRLDEFKIMLLSINYNKNIINTAISKAKTIDRSEILKRRQHTKNDRVVMAITFNPKLPSVSKIIKKHWITITHDPLMKKVFPKPPMLTFKQPRKLRRMLLRAKLPTENQARRKLKGVKPCNEPCNLCPYINTSKGIISSQKKNLKSENCSYTIQKG
jgi:peptide-methionine (R)-S-oxide reductase